MKTLMRLCALATIGAGLATFSGCSSKANVQASTTTVGQELKDLESARDEGLITESEYKKQRKRILDRK